jgi:hypothetical protein
MRANLRRTEEYSQQRSVKRNNEPGTGETITPPLIAPTPHHDWPSTALTTGPTNTPARSEPSVGHTLTDTSNRKRAP